MTVGGRVILDNGKPGSDKWTLSVCAPAVGRKFGFLRLIDQGSDRDVIRDEIRDQTYLDNANQCGPCRRWGGEAAYVDINCGWMAPI